MPTPGKIIISASVLACIVALTGCKGCEVGFEYQASAVLDPMHASHVSGSAIMGHAIDGRNSRLRLVLHGLAANRAYQVRSFDAPGCSDRELANAKRIDGASRDIDRGKTVWGFESEPVRLTGEGFGSVKQDVSIGPPDGPRRHEAGPLDYPTIVIDAAGSSDHVPGPALEPVACGRMSSPPVNLRPPT